MTFSILLGAPFGMLLGALLGTRFTVVVLYPATIVIAGVIIGSLAVHGTTVWQITCAAALGVTELQIGFVLGSATRLLTVRQAPPVKPVTHA
jgi:hypothetical protein